jgi:la-related protein 1
MEASSNFQHSSSRRSNPSWSGEVFWAKDRDSPLSEWPEHASGESYVDMRANALEQREKSAAHDYPDDMVVLYQFWSHFLVRNFNTRMFLEFCQLAEEDKERGVHDGIQNLVKYYAAAMLHHMPMREVVLTHLMELIKTEKERGQMTAFKILRSAWHNGTLNPATREKIRDSAEPELIATLDA